MWLIYSLLSALFSGTTWILAKYAKSVDAAIATAMRSLVLLGSAFLMVSITGDGKALFAVGRWEVLRLLIAGGINGLAWICYQRALAGGLSRAAALDKGSILLAMLGGWLILGEPMDLSRAFALVLILVGILLMLQRKSTAIDTSAIQHHAIRVEHAQSPSESHESHHSFKNWMFWGLLTVLFTGAAAILAKIGVRRMPSDLALALRAGTMVILSWGIAMGKGAIHGLLTMKRKDYWILLASGLASALAWICYFRALRDGEAGVVHALDKLSVLITAFAGWWLFHEKLNAKELTGLMLLAGGILLLAFV